MEFIAGREPSPLYSPNPNPGTNGMAQEEQAIAPLVAVARIGFRRADHAQEVVAGSIPTYERA
jgi:hypothetical protein